MTWRFFFLLLLLLFFWLVAPLPSIAADASVRPTWEKAELWLDPGGGRVWRGGFDDPALAKALDGMTKAGRKAPVVVIMHGCGFRKRAAWTYARNLVKAGHVVVIPDSFARPSRPATCDPWTFERLPDAPIDAVLALRLEEIAYAASRLRAAPWADPSRLYLLGHNEGGDAVAAFAGSAFRGRVVSGSACAYGVGGKGPVLSLASAADDLLEGAPADSCARAGGKAKVRALVLPGYIRDLSGVAEARRAIIDFFAGLQ